MKRARGIASVTEDVSAFDTRPSLVPEAASPLNSPLSLPAHFNVWWGLLLPAAALMTLTVVLTGEWDMRVASWVYAWGDNAWSYKNGFWTEQIIHKAGRAVTAVGVLTVLVLIAMTYLRPRLRGWRGPAIRLFTAIAISTALVSILKRYSGLDCPWSIVGLGGSNPYLTLFDLRPLKSGCFPSGHASSGYAWLALYFFFTEVRVTYRWAGLAVGVTVGLVFGIGQQLRGAHFLSHDVVTALICWVVPASLFMLRARHRQPPRGAAG